MVSHPFPQLVSWAALQLQYIVRTWLRFSMLCLCDVQGSDELSNIINRQEQHWCRLIRCFMGSSTAQEQFSHEPFAPL